MTWADRSDIGKRMSRKKPDGQSIDALYDVVASRKGADPSSSYTASLYARGTEKIAQKLGEEAVETALAAVQDDGRLVEESVDLLYHLLVLWRSAGVPASEVAAEIVRRQTGD